MIKLGVAIPRALYTEGKVLWEIATPECIIIIEYICFILNTPVLEKTEFSKGPITQQSVRYQGY